MGTMVFDHQYFWKETTIVLDFVHRGRMIACKTTSPVKPRHAYTYEVWIWLVWGGIGTQEVIQNEWLIEL